MPPDTPALRLAMSPAAPHQTDAKSQLIADYLSRYQFVTKGGLYIDGFAAPQSREHEGAWTARRVLDIEPARLRRLWLCDLDAAGIVQLRTLQALHDRKPSWRRVVVLQGDFNKLIDVILASTRIKARTPVFALLDQRNTECEWATVRKLAGFRTAGGLGPKPRRKIELLYFLGVGWLHRSLFTATSPARLEAIGRWWGAPTWTELRSLPQRVLIERVAERFRDELGYEFVHWWPVFLRPDQPKKAFVLIHASDHDQAPILMRQAFEKVFGKRWGTPADGQRWLFPDGS